MIRSAMPGDASRLAEILVFAKRVTFRPIFQDDLFSFNELRVLDIALDLRDRPGALEDVFVLEDGGIVKGLMRWNRCRAPEGLWQMQELYVDPFFQGQGIGAQLMERFLAAAREDGARQAFLWVVEENEGGRRFYHRFGFGPSGEKEFEPGTDKYLFKYVKEL